MKRYNRIHGFNDIKPNDVQSDTQIHANYYFMFTFGPVRQSSFFIIDHTVLSIVLFITWPLLLLITIS